MFWFRSEVKMTIRGQPRRRVKPLWRGPMIVVSFAICLLGGASAAGWWIWQSGWMLRATEYAKSLVITGAAKRGFLVRNVLVEGRFETPRRTLLKALRLERGAPIFAFDPKAARLRVEALPWVEKVVIERQLPDVVHLSLRERRPLALWQRGGKFFLLDSKGELIPVKDVGAYNNLIVIIGKGAPKKAVELFNLLATERKLASQVIAAVRVGGRRWNLHLNNNIEIWLPEEDANVAWRHLAMLNHKHNLLLKDLIAVDLRLPDRVVIRKSQKGKTEEERKKIQAILREGGLPNQSRGRRLGAVPRGKQISDRKT